VIKIRITGLPNEVKLAVEQLQEAFRVSAVSPPYPNRNSEYVRVYLEAETKEEAKNNDTA